MSIAAIPPAILIDNLRIERRGRTVIDTMSVSVRAGIITGLLGPSGCGKTTLMRAIVGAQRITAGSITVFAEAAGARSLRRRIGYVTQSPSIYPDLTTVENVRYFAALYGVGSDRVREVIDAVGMTAKRHEPAGNLSGGQQGTLVERVSKLFAREGMVGDIRISRRPMPAKLPNLLSCLCMAASCTAARKARCTPSTIIGCVAVWTVPVAGSIAGNKKTGWRCVSH